MSACLVRDDAIRDLFPTIDSIRNELLRQGVVNVWQDAMMNGNSGQGWSIEQLRSIPFTLLAGDIEMRFVEHLNSCVHQCIAIAEVLGSSFASPIPIDRDVLIAGALLADVGKLFEVELNTQGIPTKSPQGRMLRHPFSGVALAQRHAIPAEVLHIIACHSHEGDRADRSIECIIFHHADFIDFDIARKLGGGWSHE